MENKKRLVKTFRVHYNQQNAHEFEIESKTTTKQKLQTLHLGLGTAYQTMQQKILAPRLQQGT